MARMDLYPPEDEVAGVRKLFGEILNSYRDLGENYRKAAGVWEKALGTDKLYEASPRSLVEAQRLRKQLAERFASGQHDNGFSIAFDIGLGIKIGTGAFAIITSATGNRYLLNFNSPETFRAEYHYRLPIPRWLDRFGVPRSLKFAEELPVGTQ